MSASGANGWAAWPGRALRAGWSAIPEPTRARVRHPVQRLKLVRSREVAPFLDFAPPGHYYSPVPSLSELESRAPAASARGVAEIDLQEESQLALFGELARLAGAERLPRRPEPGRRYVVVDDEYFGEADATLYLALLRHLRPRRVVEVGSGYSSALLLDVADAELPGLEATFIEPYPDRLLPLLRPSDADAVRIIRRPVQDVPLDVFAALEPGDVLFVDSTHVAKYGSDVCHIFAEALPALADGVVIHLHDVFWPFEYPVEWLRRGRAWNEAYMVRAFLQDNARYRILFFEDWFVRRHPDLVRDRMPALREPNSGSLWLVKG